MPWRTQLCRINEEIQWKTAVPICCERIFWIDERYDNIEHDYLDEIDAQVRRYTRAATQKVENLTNRDQNVRGNLNVLLTALSRNRRAGDLVDRIQPVFQLYEQSFLSVKKACGIESAPKNGQKLPRFLFRKTLPMQMRPRRPHSCCVPNMAVRPIAAYVQGWLGGCRCLPNSKDLKLLGEY